MPTDTWSPGVAHISSSRRRFSRDRKQLVCPSARSANISDHFYREFSSMATSSIGCLTIARTPQAHT
jgi:hypothetical protein